MLGRLDGCKCVLAACRHTLAFTLAFPTPPLGGGASQSIHACTPSLQAASASVAAAASAAAATAASTATPPAAPPTPDLRSAAGELRFADSYYDAEGRLGLKNLTLPELEAWCTSLGEGGGG